MCFRTLRSVLFCSGFHLQRFGLLSSVLVCPCAECLIVSQGVLCHPPRRTAPSPCTRESSPPEPRGPCPARARGTPAPTEQPSPAPGRSCESSGSEPTSPSGTAA